MDAVREKAEQLLAQLAAIEGQIAGLAGRAEKELEAVRARYEGPLAKFRQVHKTLDAELLKLMKKNKARIFVEADQVDLKNGILLHGEEDKVHIPRDAAKKIEALKWEEALKRTVSVDREVVEKWPDERLVMIGAERKPKETFSYELK